MVIGVPKEIKAHEYRVALTPEGASSLIKDGHRVIMERGCGEGSGFEDGQYANAGAEVSDKARVFAESDLIIKVKEPLAIEYDLLRQEQAVFTYLHLAPNRPLIDALIRRKVTALAYETLEVEGRTPLLAPMSEIAGRISPIMAAYYLQKPKGGRGVLACGATGVEPANVVILGGGVVGTNAALIAHAMGMKVTVINRGRERLVKIREMFKGAVAAVESTPENILQCIARADIVIGAVYVHGQSAPKLVTKDMLRLMQKGAVIVDVAIDQGGCFETSRPTTHDDPVYEINGIIHYAVANMPGAYPRTSTIALTNATLPYIREIARLGIERAINENPAIKAALNIHMGQIVHEGLIESLKQGAS